MGGSSNAGRAWLGQYFLHLGTEVTFVDVAERITPFEEPEISAALTEILVDEGAGRHRPGGQHRGAQTA